LSSRALPQESSRPTQHRPRPVDPVHDRTSRKLACYRNQPIDVVARNKSACGNRHDFRAASRPPGLNLSDLKSIQKHAIAPAPASKRSNPSPRLDPQSRPNSLLNSHTISPSSSLSCPRGCSKIYENIIAMSRTIFDAGIIISLTIARIYSRIFDGFSEKHRLPSVLSVCDSTSAYRLKSVLPRR
jgi:hypothetical protein